MAIWDVDEARARRAADELGADVAASLEDALAADVLVTVTPGYEAVIGEGALRPGQHVCLMGADGPGKAEAAAAELARARSSATTGSRRATAASSRTRVEEGAIAWGDVTDARRVLAGRRARRRGDDEITLFDSTGLAIQDLAIALAALERAGDLICAVEL